MADFHARKLKYRKLYLEADMMQQQIKHKLEVIDYGIYVPTWRSKRRMAYLHARKLKYRKLYLEADMMQQQIKHKLEEIDYGIYLPTWRS